MRKSIHSSPYKLLLELLISRREESGVTQVQLAKRLRMTQSSVSKIERGERRLDVVELHQWCAALRISFTDFTAELDRRMGSGGARK
jgi:transcriptional regulator with XRE-family HTH domain